MSRTVDICPDCGSSDVRNMARSGYRCGDCYAQFDEPSSKEYDGPGPNGPGHGTAIDFDAAREAME
jgi:hypothetical protein